MDSESIAGTVDAAVPVRLMIVDDHADVRYLIRAIVQDAGGGEVVVAGEADGAQSALEAIDGVDPDVVVLDARMPVVDGFEAAPLLLERRPGQKILLCSALVDDTVRARAAAAGIAACVSKDDLEAIPRIARELAGA
jgi:CheY-like chemotaxis protein